MTIKEKIKNLVFFDLIVKLKDILGNISDSIKSLTGRVSTLESSSGGGGGSQDLQSVMENGDKYFGSNGEAFGFSIIPQGFVIDSIAGGMAIASGQNLITSTLGNPNEKVSLSIEAQPGKTLLFKLNTDLDEKINGYTLSTLDDITAVGSLIPTYADNASAITGGLAVNHLYKTATGEIRVRV